MRGNQRRYKARVTGHKFGQAKTGTDQIGVAFTLVGGDRDGERLIEYFPLTEAAIEYTWEKLKNAGWDGQDAVALDGLGSVDCSIVVEDEEGQDGKLYERVKFVNSEGVVMKNEMGKTQLNDFAARMRGQLAAFQAKNGIVRNGPKGGGARPAGGGGGSRRASSPDEDPDGLNGPPPSDDDIPF